MTPFDVGASWIVFAVMMAFLATMAVVIYRIKPVVSRQQFAMLSFMRDRGTGLYPKTDTFASIPKDEREDYLEEADLYLAMPRKKWPTDILQALSKRPTLPAK